MLPTNPLLNATAPAGPHLPVALLRQYAAGTLAPAAQHRVEAHTLACPRCADILEGLLQTPAATTDQTLAQLQQRLRQRVQQQAAPARQLATPRQHRWLAPQLAAAAALLLGLVAGGWWTWQQRQHAPAGRIAVATAPRVAAPTLPAPAALHDTLVLPKAVTSAPVATLPTRPRATAPTVARPARSRPGATAASVGQAALAAAPARDSVVLAEVNTPVAAPPVAAAPARVSEPLAKLRAAMPPPPALPASPTGGYAALREYLKKSAAEFEPESRDGGRQPGRVLVRLHLGADGKIEQAEAVRKLRPDYDAEAVRLLQEGPTWIPGITAGRRAAQVVEVPVVFE